MSFFLLLLHWLLPGWQKEREVQCKTPLMFHFSFPLKMEYSNDLVPCPHPRKMMCLVFILRENDFKILGFKSRNSEAEMDHFKYYPSAKMLVDTYPQRS